MEKTITDGIRKDFYLLQIATKINWYMRRKARYVLISLFSNLLY